MQLLEVGAFSSVPRFERCSWRLGGDAPGGEASGVRRISTMVPPHVFAR